MDGSDSGSRQSVGMRGEVCGRMVVIVGEVEALNSDPSVRRMKPCTTSLNCREDKRETYSSMIGMTCMIYWNYMYCINTV